MSDSDSDPIAVEVVRETEKAFLLRKRDDGQEAWFPQSQVSFENMNTKTWKGLAKISSWLLDEKGW